MDNSKAGDITQVLVTLEGHEHEIKSLKHRMDTAEKKQDELVRLTTAVNELAVSVKYLAEGQEKQGDRIEKLEREPADDAKYFKRIFISCIITSIVSGIIGAVIGLLI